jgi:hypothetical protein
MTLALDLAPSNADGGAPWNPADLWRLSVTVTIHGVDLSFKVPPPTRNAIPPGEPLNPDATLRSCLPA